MASYLIDLVLVAALVVTAVRSGRMMKELKQLRSSESSLALALREADEAITRASSAVVALKHEGIDTVRALEHRIEEAREAQACLDAMVERADWHTSRRERVLGARERPNGREPRLREDDEVRAA